MNKAVSILLSLGILITLWVMLFEADRLAEPDGSIDMQGEIVAFLMLLGPWLLLMLFFVKKFNLLGILIVAILMFASELVAYYTTFIAPGSSTSALIYAVKPVYQVLLIIPFGLLVGKAITFLEK